MARASEQEQTGSVGVSESLGKFGRIGFGFAEITRHDNGTDVFLMVRDARRFELGLTLAAQIKGGPSWFSRLKKDSNGVIEGWWFEDPDGSHIRDWLRHDLPHLLVVHDLEADVTYWVLVEDSAVVPMKKRRLWARPSKGRKILIPASQTVDEDSRDQLIEIAARKRKRPAWEGTAWRGVSSLAEVDVLRHGLLAPRLVAPHPNLTPSDELSPAQAIALVMRARLGDVQNEIDRGHVPGLEVAKESDEWSWRFFAALHERVRTGSIEPLTDLAATAPDAESLTAATVCLAASQMEEGRPDDAIEVLQKAIAKDIALPVDHGWMCVQLARALVEVGRLDEAKELAASVQALAATHSEDVTATGIAGVGAELLFTIAGWQEWTEANVGKTIEASDTSISWWRQQMQCWGLDDALERQFKTWSQDSAFVIARSDTARNELVAATLNATLIGSQSSWKHLSSLVGQDALLRTDRGTDVAEVKEGLSLLRLAGQKTAVLNATRRIVADGPAEAVRQEAALIDFASLTHTTAQASLALLRAGGRVLDRATADRATLWLLETLKDPAGFLARVRPNFLLSELVETLAGTLLAASPAVQAIVRAHVLSMPAVGDQLAARAWAQVVSTFWPEAWELAEARAAYESSGHHHEWLGLALKAAVREHVDEVNGDLADAVASGSSAALSSWGAVDTLPTEVVSTLLPKVVEMVAAERRLSDGISIRGGGSDPAQTLALLNCWHDDLAEWGALFDFLEDASVLRSSKVAAIQTVASNVTRLTPAIVERLRQIAQAVLDTEPAPVEDLFGHFGSSHSSATLESCLALLDRSAPLGEPFVRLMAGGPRDRIEAARIAASREPGSPAATSAEGVLVALASDASAAVRAYVVGALARRAVQDDAPRSVWAVLQMAAEDSGFRLPFAAATALVREDHRSSAAQQLLDQLCQHPFQVVRRAAQGL